jgi:cell wall-associated NlpC family hydrolase
MWSAILMSDRSTGWLPTHYLKFTGVSVDITSQVETTGRQDSDDSVSGYTGGYQSNHPAVRYALRWLGTPYRYGGESTRGIDCSSLVQKSFAACGKKLPRVSRDQAKVGQRVEAKDLQPGDRLYFSASGTHVDHTGIYMGNGLFVHASGGARKVTVSRLSDKRNWNIFVGARR